MRIERENGDPVGSVWAVFTAEEAHDLLEALWSYFEEEEPRDPEWHSHIGAGPDSELTVAIEDLDAPRPPHSHEATP